MATNGQQGEHEHIKEKYGLVRSLGLLQATALNMSNMVGIGPFITIPLLLASMGGPQALLGWVLGAALALCDGLIWAELAAAMPGAGGTFVYLLEAFRKTRLGRVLPFLFIWQFIFSGPLEIASGYIGFAQYFGYFWRGMEPMHTRMVGLLVGVVAIILLYRGITAIGKTVVVLWAGMLITVGWVIVTGLFNFNPELAFDFPPNAIGFSTGFAMGLGSAMLLAMYNCLGYFGICNVGGEVRNPERVIPRSIIISVIAVSSINFCITLSVIGVIPWREAINSSYVASEFMERVYGGWAGSAITVLILWSAFSSVFALLLGYSRIPYAAALDGHFFRVFAKLHPRSEFPYVSLLVIGVLSAAASLLDLSSVISALMTARILIQFIGQIFAVHYIRKHRPDIERPFRIWLYPIPSVIALLGWVYIFATSGVTFILYGFATVLAGLIAYAIWSRQTTGRQAI